MHPGMRFSRPMGGGFTPASLNPILWLTPGPAYCFTDAAKTVPCGNGDLVYTWADRSGNGHDFTRSDAGTRPTLTLTGSVWSVSFSATSKRIDGGNLSAHFPTSASLGFRYSQTGDGRCLMSTIAGADGWDRIGGLSYPQYLRAARLDGQTNLGTGTHTQVILSTTGAWSRRYDGTQNSSDGGSWGATATNFWVIGGRQVGECYDVVACANVLTTGECEDLEAYLAGTS